MTTVETIITRLIYDFGCTLTTQQMLDILNVLENRLAVDIVRKTQVTEIEAVPGKEIYYISFPAKYITRVFANNKEIKKQSIENLDGYFCDNTEIILSRPLDEGHLYIESIIVPQTYDESNMSELPLFLGDGYDEIYLYHILSREALMSGDIDMLNNYSLLYAEALNALKADVFRSQNSTANYKNVW